MKKTWLAPRKISTPNLTEDIEKYLGGKLKDRYSGLTEEKKKKLEVLVERIEFIEHLLVFAEFVKRNSLIKKEITKTEKNENGSIKIYQKVNYQFELYGKDLGGAQFDVEALLLYLLMTCIDTIKGQPKHIDSFKWISENAVEYSNLTPEEFSKKVLEKKEEYQENFGLSRRFREAFTHDLNKSLKDRLTENLLALKLNKQGLTDEKLEHWNKKTQEEKLRKIANTLYSIRSTYTHASIRTFLPRQPIDNTPDLKGEFVLCKQGENFIEIMLDMIKFLIHKHIK